MSVRSGRVIFTRRRASFPSTGKDRRMSDITPCNLLRRCFAGRRAGDWQEFIDRHGGEVRRTVLRAAIRCGLPLEDQDFDELVQDFYCRLFSARRKKSSRGKRGTGPRGGGLKEGFRGCTEEELWRYVIRVAHSLVVDRLRLLGASKRTPRDKIRSLDTSRLRSPKLDPEEQLLKKERRKVFFERCLEVVSCDRVGLELRALAMALLEGWSSREIADQLKEGLSAERVDKLVSLLRQRLGQDGIRLPRRYCVSVSTATC